MGVDSTKKRNHNLVGEEGNIMKLKRRRCQGKAHNHEEEIAPPGAPPGQPA